MDDTSISKQRRTVRGRLAANTRHHPDRTDLIENDQARLRELALETHIRAIVDQAPTLTPAQKDRIAGLLRTPPAGGA
jgi:hypothetical protein